MLRRRAWSKSLVTVAAMTLLASGVLAAASSIPASAASVSTAAAFKTAWENPSTTTIDLAADVTLTCTEGEPARNTSNAIVVDGHGHTLAQSCASNRVIAQLDVGAVTLQDIAVTGGHGEGNGGALLTGGDVVVTDATITENQATGEGGAIEVDKSGTLTVLRSTFSTNESGGSGGAVAVQGLTTVTDSTFNDNTSGGNGGAMRTYGGALIVNSTVTGNQSQQRGAVVGGPITLAFATIVGNGGATSANVDPNGATLDSFASVIGQAQGFGRPAAPNCATITTTTSTGYNVDDDGSCGFGAGPGDQSGLTTPFGLGALADNGGATQTMLPAAGSPLLDQVSTAACSPTAGSSTVTGDQRGVSRPQGPACDIGAVEVEVSAPTTTTTSSTSTATPPSGTASGPPAATPVPATPTYTG